MTSRETEDFLFHLNALCFNNEHDFQVYALTHKYPLGSCVIGFGKGAKKYDDTFLPEKFYN